MIHVEYIDSMERLGAIRAEWNELLFRCEHPEVFLTHEWAVSWWKECHGRAALAVLVAREEGRAIGIAPLMRLSRRCLGLPFCAIEFISMWKYAGSAASSLGGMDVIVPERHAEIIGAFLDALDVQKTAWHVIRLHPVPENSPTLDALQHISAQRGVAYRRETVMTRYNIAAPADGTGYDQRISDKLRTRLREAGRRLARMGSVAITEHSSPDEVDRAFDEVLGIERNSWKWEKGIAVNSTVFGDFYRRLAREASRSGWLTIRLLRLDGIARAYGIFIRLGRNVDFLKTGYDEQYAKYSTGALLMRDSFTGLFRSGAVRIGMLGGDPDYKRHWRAEPEPLAEVFVFGRGRYPRLLHVLLFQAHLYGRFRRAEILFKRILRRLGIPWQKSELTRMDQLHRTSHGSQGT